MARKRKKSKIDIPGLIVQVVAFVFSLIFLILYGDPRSGMETPP